VISNVVFVVESNVRIPLRSKNKIHKKEKVLIAKVPEQERKECVCVCDNVIGCVQMMRKRPQKTRECKMDVEAIHSIEL
jgi:hypothetical protein